MAQHATRLFGLCRERIIRIRFLAEGNRCGQKVAPCAGPDWLYWLPSELGRRQCGTFFDKRANLLGGLGNVRQDDWFDTCCQCRDGFFDGGQINDARRFVINTFRDDGGLVDLHDYPRLANHLRTHEADVRRRHVSQKNPSSWFRTIDRVYPHLANEPKLLVPDIAGANEIVFERGRFHPHHNLYFITSEEWDLEVLGGLLSSRVALFFVWSYAVKMRGGYLRFQAQYLRRIRVPSPSSLANALADSIRSAFRARAFSRLDELALEAYELDGLPDFDFVDTRS